MDKTYCKRWTGLLQNRLDWELEQGLVTEDDNIGWIFAPNTPVGYFGHEMTNNVRADKAGFAARFGLVGANG